MEDSTHVPYSRLTIQLCKTIITADSIVCQSVPLCKTIITADSTVCQSVPLCKTIMADSTVSLHYHNIIVQELINVLYSRLTVQLASFVIAFFNRQTIVETIIIVGTTKEDN